jgi:hypothetical protein
MDDLERWLSAAMRAVRQEPSQGLLSGVWRRRHDHFRRVRAGGVAAVVAVAITVPSVLYSAQHGAAGRVDRRPGEQTAPARAAPGSELLTCGTYGDRGISGGELSPHWKSASVPAGPIWFVFARSGLWRSSHRLAGGRFRAVQGVVLAVPNGSTVEITTPPADRARFRFITRSASSGTYTLRNGVPALTVAACPKSPVAPGMPEAYAAGLTLFYLPLGYVTDLGRCLPLEIATPPAWHVRWSVQLSAHGVCKT